MLSKRIDSPVGKCVVPAFADSHLHFASFSLFLSTVDVRTVRDFCEMHTHWPARLSFDEATRGTLTVGKIADFVVLDRNPLKVTLDKLTENRVENLSSMVKNTRVPLLTHWGLSLKLQRTSFCLTKMPSLLSVNDKEAKVLLKYGEWGKWLE